MENHDLVMVLTKVTVNRLNFLDWGSIPYVGNVYPCMRVRYPFTLVCALTLQLLTMLLVVPAIGKSHRSYLNQIKYEFVEGAVMDLTCDSVNIGTGTYIHKA
jgi:hypothetical protein